MRRAYRWLKHCFATQVIDYTAPTSVCPTCGRVGYSPPEWIAS